MSEAKGIRHGDLLLVMEIDGQPITLPKGLQASSEKVIMRGSNNNPHSFDNGVFYPHTEGQFGIGYFVSKNTTLYHRTHGCHEVSADKKASKKIPDMVYLCKKQNEDTHDGMKPVLD